MSKINVPGGSAVNGFLGRAEDDIVGDAIIIGLGLIAAYWLYTQIMNAVNGEINQITSLPGKIVDAVEAPFVAAGDWITEQGDWITEQGDSSTPDDPSTVQVDSGYASGA